MSRTSMSLLRSSRLVIILLLHGAILKGTSSTSVTLLVSHFRGHDTETCGSTSNPCQKLSYTINKRTVNKTTIILDGSSSISGEISIYKIEDEIVIDKHVTIQALTTIVEKPIISVAKHTNVTHAFRIGNGFTNASLVVKSIAFINIGVAKFNTYGLVKLVNCYVKESGAVFGGIYGESITIHAISSTFKDASSILEIRNSFKEIDLIFDRCTFYGNRDYPFLRRGILIHPKIVGLLNVNIKSSTFLWMAYALLIKVKSKQQSDVIVSVNDSYFNNNNINRDISFDFESYGTAISCDGCGTLNIEHSYFTDNTGQAGAALYVKDVIKVSIKFCTFTRNSVTVNGGACLFIASRVQIDSSVFQNNSAHSLGGAIANVNGSSLYLNNCSFDGNHAYIFGGSIYHTGIYQEVVNSSFIGSNEGNSFQGSLFYSTKHTVVRHSTFEARATHDLYANPKAVVFHSGTDKMSVMDIQSNTTFQCQIGHKIISLILRVDSTRIIQAVHPRSSLVVLLMLYCLPCARGTYSLERESFQRTGDMEIKKNITCLKCPQGGICENGIRSLPNFWGWKTKNEKEIQFIPCRSPSYCCWNETACKSYNSCGKNRNGMICGSCKKGYTESILSDRCIPNSECNNATWFWFIFVIIGFCYTFVLMYMKDIFSYLKKCLGFSTYLKRQLKKSQQLFFITPDGNLEQIEENDYIIINNTEGRQNMTEPLLSDYTLSQGIISDYFRYESQPESTNVNDENSTVHGSDYDDLSVSMETSGQVSLIRSVSNVQDIQQANDRRIRRKWYSYVSGVVKILAFFYQMQLLSKIPSTLEDSYSYGFNGARFLKEFVTGVFNVGVAGVYNINDICLLPNLQPVKKQLLKILFVLFLFFILSMAYLAWYFKAKLFRYKNRSPDQQNINQSPNPFDLRVKCCCVQILLFAYSTLATGSFKFISCIEVNGRSYLYLDGQYECNQWWFYFACCIVLCWTVPLFIALYGANKLLRSKHITVRDFFIILIFPPTLIYYGCRYLVTRDKLIETENESKYRDQILLVLEEPFRKVSDKNSAWYWESILIFRRLVLICIYVFIIDPIGRLYAMCIPLTLFLVNHLRTKPYNSRFLNWLETASLILLCLLLSLNLFWAYNYVTHVPITPILSSISHVFLYVETLILLLPIGALVLFVLFLVCRKVWRSRNN